MHNPPPSRDLNTFAKHLQDLENRRRQYAIPTPFMPARNPLGPKSYTTSAAPLRGSQHAPTGVLTSPEAIRTSAPRVTTPMDLSNTRPRTDKERGACYLCHQIGHLARGCSLPNPRHLRRGSNDSQRHRVQNIKPRSPSPLQSPSNRYAVLQPVADRPPTPAYDPNMSSYSENGTGLL